MLNETFWVGLAVILFIALIFKPVGKIIVAALDKHSEDIKKELAEAVRLKEEAQAILASYRGKQKEAEKEAKDIIEHAKSEAARMKEEAIKQLDKEVEKRTELIEQKIVNMEANAVKELKDNAVDIAVDTAREVMSHKLKKTDIDRLVGASIDNLDQRFN